MSDPFGQYQPGLDAPAATAFAITPGSSDLAKTTRAIYVGGAGDVTVTMLDGSSVTFVGVPAGTFMPIRATKVTAATASDLIGLD